MACSAATGTVSRAWISGDSSPSDGFGARLDRLGRCSAVVGVTAVGGAAVGGRAETLSTLHGAAAELGRQPTDTRPPTAGTWEAATKGCDLDGTPAAHRRTDRG